MSLREKEAGREFTASEYRFQEKLFVPSNEHAAEVIGKSGHKIKRIARSTHTVINCPSPEDPPIFEIFGSMRECVLNARKLIQHHSNHFDKMRNKKRKIDLRAGEVVRTAIFNKVDVPCIIGKGGKQIKTIVHHSKVKVISPDTNKEPIFILHGRESDIEKCIFWMKLISFSSSGSIYFTQNEYLMIYAFLESPLSVKNDFFENIHKFANLRSLRNKLRNIKFHELNRDAALKKTFLYCWHCKEKKSYFAKGLCGHFLCCDKCIATLFADIYLKCYQCSNKIETFLIY